MKMGGGKNWIPLLRYSMDARGCSNLLLTSSKGAGHFTSIVWTKVNWATDENLWPGEIAISEPNSNKVTEMKQGSFSRDLS